MKQHRIGAAVGILLLGLLLPLSMSVFQTAKAALILGYLWGVTVFPFTIYLGFISGKYIRGMWYYPLLYSAALLGVHIAGNGGRVNPENVGLLVAIAVISSVSMVFWALVLRKRNKTE